VSDCATVDLAIAVTDAYVYKLKYYVKYLITPNRSHLNSVRECDKSHFCERAAVTQLQLQSSAKLEV
jgi:hypothetical protein